MTQDFGPCAKCGKPTPWHSHYVPPVTWKGGMVCAECQAELQRLQPKANYERQPGGHFRP